MKPIIYSVALLMALSAFADTPISRDEAAAVKTFDLDELGLKRPTLKDGTVVKLKFNYRGKDVEKDPTGMLKGEICISADSKFGCAYVRVPPEGSAWFLKLPNDTKRSSILVFGRLARNEDGESIVSLLGREIKTDSKGSRIVW